MCQNSWTALKDFIKLFIVVSFGNGVKNKPQNNVKKNSLSKFVPEILFLHVTKDSCGFSANFLPYFILSSVSEIELHPS